MPLNVKDSAAFRDLPWVDLHTDWPARVQRMARAVLEPC
jgi:hypothetical protein